METGWRRDWLRATATAKALVPLLTIGCAPGVTDDVEDTAAARARAEARGSDTAVSRVASALVGATPKRTRTVAAMLLDQGLGTLDMTVVANALKGPGNSLTSIFNEASYGLQQVAVDVYGPNMLPSPECPRAPPSSDPNNGPTVTQLIAALPMTYDHYFLYLIGRNAGCTFGSASQQIGTPTQPAAYSIYNATTSLVAVAQTLGVNLGMAHEPTMTCPGPETFLDDTSQCAHNEFGNRLSFMGGGPFHPSAYHKYAQGWIDKCNVVAVGASGTFNLVPQELACDGVQLLQIPAPKARAAPPGDRQNKIVPLLSYYYAEMRAPVGFDAGLGPMVVISIGPDVPTTTMPAPQVYVLDMMPQLPGGLGVTDAGLITPGQSYSDPAGGMTITLMTISEQSATISVTTTATGGNVCAGGTPFTAPGPDGASCAPLTGATGAGGATGGGGPGGTGGAVGAGGAGGAAGSPGTGGATLVGSGGNVAATGGRTGSGGGTGMAGGTGVAGADGGPPGATGGRGASAAGGPGGGCSCSNAPMQGPTTEWLSFLAAAAALAGRRRSMRQARTLTG